MVGKSIVSPNKGKDGIFDILPSTNKKNDENDKLNVQCFEIKFKPYVELEHFSIKLVNFFQTNENIENL